MSAPIRFVPRSTLNAKANLREFVEQIRSLRTPLGLECNHFESHAWSISGVVQKGGNHKFIYFAQLGFDRRKCGARNGMPVVVPNSLLMRQPFLSFSKALINYLHDWETTTSVSQRLVAFRFLETALYELNGCTCPTATTPEVMNRAIAIASESLGPGTTYIIGTQLTLIYRYMVELALLTVPSEWKSSLPPPKDGRNCVGKDFDQNRQKKLPSPQALDALAAIFNSDTDDPTAIFATSLCGIMLCAPDRSVEALYAPLDILAPDWTDPKTGEVGTGLRWFPAKGAAPMVKTVIPSMREVAVRAVDKLRRLSAPARKLARWYEKHPDQIYLPSHLEYLRSQERINQNEIHAILFGGQVQRLTRRESCRTHAWLRAHDINRQSRNGSRNSGTLVAFADLERAVLAELPDGFPIMDTYTGMRYSEALCIARTSEFVSSASTPMSCCFDRISYSVLYRALKSNERNSSIFEKFGYRDLNGEPLELTSHMLRHYLNTLVRQSGTLTEDEIAKWSGRRNVQQNATYNHESDRDILAKLRDAVGDPSLSVGPFANIDNRIFIRRDEFANIKIITAHTTEFGYCIHDYAQSPCQVNMDCINCDEQVCVKGDRRAEENLRRMQIEMTMLQEKAKAAFCAKQLGAAEWFQHQTKTLERVNQLIQILDDPNVPQGAVIGLSGVTSASRLAMAGDVRGTQITSVSQTIKSIVDVRGLLTNTTMDPRKIKDACKTAQARKKP